MLINICQQPNSTNSCLTETDKSVIKHLTSTRLLVTPQKLGLRFRFGYHFPYLEHVCPFSIEFLPTWHTQKVQKVFTDKLMPKCMRIYSTLAADRLMLAL